MAGDEAREVDGSEIMKGLCAHVRNVFLKAVGSHERVSSRGVAHI